jgi:hypothetical protein
MINAKFVRNLRMIYAKFMGDYLWDGVDTVPYTTFKFSTAHQI